MRYATVSVTYVFVSAAEQAKLAKVIEFSNRVLKFFASTGTLHAAKSVLNAFGDA